MSERPPPVREGDRRGAPPPERPVVRAWRLVATLGAIGALAGLLIIVVYGWTQPAIRAHKAEMLRIAIEEVLKAPHRYDTLYLYLGQLTAEPPTGVDRRMLEQVYVGYRESGERVGFAVRATEPGFQDLVVLLYGYDPATETLLGMKVLESRETPGLGDKILKDTHFIAEFAGAAPPLLGVKAGAGEDDPQKVDMITGATISSRAVIRAINSSVERLGPLLDAYREEGGR